MSRTKVIAGNWKMYKNLDETRELVGGIKAGLAGVSQNVRVVVCPPFTSLALAAELAKGSIVHVGAQNISEFDEGAYTAEISWKMLKGAGCEYVILGHSERRQIFGEQDDLINRKAKKALAAGLLPILCVGETLAEREANQTTAVVTRQVQGVLSGLSVQDMSRIIIAYEPVWAIGTGRTATPAQAEEVHVVIRKLVEKLYDAAVASQLVIQYGGSVKPDNAAELLGQPDIDGALVGGACLKADSFLQIVKAAG
jgi:triosephosphate isomerase (TIM)